MSAAYNLMIKSKSCLFSSSILFVVTLIYLLCTVSASPSLHPDEGLVVSMHYIIYTCASLCEFELNLILFLVCCLRQWKRWRISLKHWVWSTWT